MALYAQKSYRALSHLQHHRAAAHLVPSPRSFSRAVPVREVANEKKKEKDEIYVASNEYSKSGDDQQAAQTEQTAFSRNKTDPNEQREHAEYERREMGHKSNPLDVSPANRQVSEATERHPHEDAKQTKSTGQESKKTTPPKHEGLRRYAASTDTMTSGTGANETRRDEKPGPAFAGTRGR